MAKEQTRTLLLALLLAAFFVGCQSGTQSTETSEGEEGSSRGSSVLKSLFAETVSVTIPADTPIAIRLGSTLDTGSAENGESFAGTLSEPISAGGTIVAPAGSAVEGKIAKAVSSGRLKTPAEIHLVLTSLTLKGGKDVAISTNTWSMKGPSHAKRNIGMIGGGAGAGALIGGLTGGKKGAAIGAGIGAGAGTAGAAATGKKEITLPPETTLNFKLTSAVEVTVPKQGE